MRFILFLLAILAPSAATAQSTQCLSIDGQVRVAFQGEIVSAVTIRVPAQGRREAGRMRLLPGDVIVQVVNESAPSTLTEGCDGVGGGTVAIVKTTIVTTRRVRIRLADGGAFPSVVAGRTADGDAVERELTCTRSDSVMASCP